MRTLAPQRPGWSPPFVARSATPPKDERRCQPAEALRFAAAAPFFSHRMPKEEPFPLPHEIFPEEWFARLERTDLFPDDRPLELDLGCGDGSFLVRLAEHHPERDFLGVERLLGRVRKVSRKIDRAGLDNARVLRVDSNYAVHRLLPRDAFRRIHFLCPDPWPKKKHARRRQMCQVPFLEALHGLLEDEGELLFKTDSPAYYDEAAEVLETRDFFRRIEWRDDDFFYPLSDFEEQWLDEGRTIRGMRLRKG